MHQDNCRLISVFSQLKCLFLFPSFLHNSHFTIFLHFFSSPYYIKAYFIIVQFIFYSSLLYLHFSLMHSKGINVYFTIFFEITADTIRSFSVIPETSRYTYYSNVLYIIYFIQQYVFIFQCILHFIIFR